MTTVCVIADTHLPRGSRRLTEETVRHLAAADLILHAGDVTTAAVLAELATLGPVEAVDGNADAPELRAMLPETRIVEVDGARIGMIHDAGRAAGRAERLRARFPDCDAIVYGHTHLPEVGRADGVWILNPGSPTERRRGPYRSLLLLEIEAGTITPKLVPLP